MLRSYGFVGNQRSSSLELLYIFLANLPFGTAVSLGLFLFGGYHGGIPKFVGALLLLFFFLGVLGMLSDANPSLPRNKETGLALFLFFVPLGIVSAFLKLFLRRVGPKTETRPRIEPPVLKG